MQRLSGMAASFLYMETPTLHTPVVGTRILDPSTMPEPRNPFDALEELIRSGAYDRHLTRLRRAARSRRDAVLEALEAAGGVKKRAAKLLGITFRSVRYRLEKLGVEAEGAKLAQSRLRQAAERGLGRYYAPVIYKLFED